MADRRILGFSISPFARYFAGANYRVQNPAVLQRMGYASGDLPAAERAAVQSLMANKSTGLAGAELAKVMRITDALRRGGNQPFQIVVQVDWARLAAALRDIDINGTHGGVGIYRALNHTAGKVRTYLKRSLTQWTGLNRVKPADQALTQKYAGPGHLEAAIIVKDKFASITAENFGAVWNRSMPGVQHRAWNRVQIAQGSFMIPGKKPAFHRVGPGRFPIKPLFGPNYAREVERHEREVRGVVEGMMRTDFIPRVRHEIEREIARVKAKHGL